MSTGFIFTLVISFAILYIGVITALHDRKSATNVLFGLISIATVFWSFANFFSLEPRFFSSLVLARLVLFFAIPHVLLFYLFVRNFPSKEFIPSKKFTGFLIVLGIILMGLTLTPFIFNSLHLVGTALLPVPGVLMPIFALFVLGLLIASMVVIIRKYFNAPLKEKAGWRALLVGFFVSYVALIITNFVFVNALGETHFILYGPLLMVPAIFGTAYSILRYRLFNVKAIATEIIVFVLLSITLVQIFLSQNTAYFIFNSGIFVSFLVVGVFLIKSVLAEVAQRERLEVLSGELALANDKLQDLDKLKTEFLSLASHQLRSPLTAIKGYTSMLLDGSFGAVNASQKEAIDRVFQSSQHLTKVVEDLLNVTKIEQGGMKYEMASFDLTKPSKELADDLSITAKKKGLELTFSTDNQGPYMVVGDMEKLRQVILNLIDNSIKYTEKGFIKVSLTRNLVSNKIIFAVTDSGMGMTPEIKASLFQKFSRGEGSKVNAGGSGLGLYLAKQIVEAHKGRVWVESPGKGLGSTFAFEMDAVK